MNTIINFLSDDNLFLRVITVLFAFYALKNGLQGNGAKFWYGSGAVILNCAVLSMGAK